MNTRVEGTRIEELFTIVFIYLFTIALLSDLWELAVWLEIKYSRTLNWPDSFGLILCYSFAQQAVELKKIPSDAKGFKKVAK